MKPKDRPSPTRPKRKSAGDVSPAGPEIEGLDFPLFDTLPVAAFVFESRSGALLSANRAATRQYGWARGEIRQMSLDSLFCEGTWDFGEEPAAARHRRKDGSILDVEVTVRPLPGMKPPALGVLYAVDETEKKELEARFLRAQRLECIGTLASGVAHDLNNVLAPIMMSASMLREDLPDEVRQEFLEAIEQSAQRGVNLLKQVLTFARGVEGKRVPLRPEALIGEVADLARRTFPKLIQIRTRSASRLWEIEGDATRLHQVLLNLVVNARDAMESGGTLNISAKNREITAPMASRIEGAAAGRYVAFSIQDSGVGISREMLRSIFTPFFTTKQPGKGTGLGLPTVLGIVKSHGGFVEVYSRPGKGSTFTACLPVRDAAKPSASPLESSDTNGEAAILVVDDDPGIRRMVKAVLTRQGYKVTLAESGEEGLAEFNRRQRDFRLILVDLIMPGMDGVALAGALKKVDPGVKIVATSGIDCEVRLKELEALGIPWFLKKPYLSSQLVGLIAEVTGV